MKPTTKLKLTRVVDRELQPPTYDVRRLPPLATMEFNDTERERLTIFMNQVTRYRRSTWWRRLVEVVRRGR